MEDVVRGLFEGKSTGEMNAISMVPSEFRFLVGWVVRHQFLVGCQTQCWSFMLGPIIAFFSAKETSVVCALLSGCTT